MTTASWIYTAKDTKDRFTGYHVVPCTPAAGELSSIYVDSKSPRQKILGFGGAFTDTAAMALAVMKEPLQEKAIRAYFDPDIGLGYNMGRVPIGACDFSSVPYSHAETPGDIALSEYTIAQDRKGIIPLIRRARAFMSEDIAPLLLYALPWSPPAWMKSNARMVQGGRLLPQHYGTMARYLLKFVEAYEEEGIPIWGLSAQNEPTEIQQWPSCEYSGEEERRFLRDYLIPTLDRAGRGDLSLMFWDCNKDDLPDRAEAVLSDPSLYARVYGAAFHWYSGDYFESLEKVHGRFPDTHLISTECCTLMPEDLSDWSMGERYAHDMIGNFNHWTSAWLDWNLFLDTNSGPNVWYNPIAAPIILDREHQEVILLSSYYYIGHFSRYIRRGARALSVTSTPNCPLECCAFRNPNGSYVAVIMNRSSAPIRGTLQVEGCSFPAVMDPHSIGTLII